MIVRYCDKVVPEAGAGDGLEAELRDRCIGLVARVFERVDSLSFDDALREIEGVIRDMNRYVEREAPWGPLREGRL